MRKSLHLLVAIIAIHLSAFAQPSATEGKVEFQKGDKPAAVIEIPYSPDIVEAAIKDNLSRKGIKEDRTKGFQVFRGAKIGGDSELTDLYFKVERKSRKDKDISIIYLIAGRPNENIALRTADDSYKVTDGKAFLNDLIPAIEAHNLEVMIGEQDETVKKSEKKLRNLEDDQKDLEKKIRNLEEKLAQNKKDQETQNADISKQQEIRDAMQSRRK